MQEKSNYDSLDILFVGNSYTYSSIQPSVLSNSNISSYNLGISTAGIEFYELIINDYLNNVSTYPKVISLLVTPMTFSSKSDNYSSYPIHRYLENPISNIELAIRYNKFNNLIAMYKKSLKKGFTNLISAKKGNPTKVKNTARGFISSDIIVNDSIISQHEYLYKPFINEVLNIKLINQLKSLTQSIESKGIEVQYLELPTNRLESYFNKSYLLQYEHALKKIGEKNNLLRINKSLFLPIHYRNIDHMNTEGSIIATNEVLRQLEGNLTKPPMNHSK